MKKLTLGEKIAMLLGQEVVPYEFPGKTRDRNWKKKKRRRKIAKRDRRFNRRKYR